MDICHKGISVVRGKNLKEATYSDHVTWYVTWLLFDPHDTALFIFVTRGGFYKHILKLLAR